ncbi:hypothetical protein [Saccharothrix deserti]|uniref:hypothetical protein n=1 Tax=Saccharothrix deserti TaxID=2593674 RepID=UPI00139100C6|nr:hypothetical protein [Saccharothrix deserti]
MNPTYLFVNGASIAFAGESAYASMLHDTAAGEGIQVGQLIPGAIQPGHPTHDPAVLADTRWHLHPPRAVPHRDNRNGTGRPPCPRGAQLDWEPTQVQVPVAPSDALTGEPVAAALDLGPWDVRVLVSGDLDELPLLVAAAEPGSTVGVWPSFTEVT